MWFFTSTIRQQQFCKLFTLKVFPFLTEYVYCLQQVSILALKTHQPVWLGACPRPTIMTRGVYMVALLGSLLAPAGLKERTRGTKGIEERTGRGEKSPTSRMKRTGVRFHRFLMLTLNLKK